MARNFWLSGVVGHSEIPPAATAAVGEEIESRQQQVTDETALPIRSSIAMVDISTIYGWQCLSRKS
jgi:hypothetical protein